MTRSKMMFGLAASALLSACSTSLLPSAEQLKLKDFRENVAALDDAYMDGSDVPAAPTNVRSASEWDEAVRELEALGRSAVAPAAGEKLTDEDFRREFERLQAAAVAYREDDPK